MLKKKFDLRTLRRFAPTVDKAKEGERKGAVIYTRVSSKMQEDGYSLESQLQYCQKLAEEMGLTVLASFGGKYESASKDEREEFGRMLKFIKRNKSVGHILVYKYNRFSRTGANAIYISSELKKSGVFVHSATQRIDPTTVVGAFQENLQHIISNYENEQRKEVCINGTRNKLLDGYWVGHPPTGYDNHNPGRKKKPDLVMNDQGKLIKKAFQLKARHDWPLSKINDHLESLGWKYRRARLYEILRNPFYCGFIVHKLIPGQVIAHKHPPLISRELFLRVNALIDGQGIAKGYKWNKDDENLPLRGFILSAKDGTPYTGYLVKAKGLYYYKNNRKGAKENISARKLHQSFLELLQSYSVSNPGYLEGLKLVILTKYAEMKATQIEEAEAIQKQVAQLQAKAEKLEERFVFGEIERDQYLKYKAKIDAEISDAKQKGQKFTLSLSNLENQIDEVIEIAPELAQLWESSDYDEKQRIQKLVFPDGLVYDFQNNTYRTANANPVFAAIPLFMKNSANSKNKKGRQSADLSYLVAGARLELTTFGL